MHLSKVVWALITLLPITLCQDTRLATVQEAFRSASVRILT